MGNINQKLENWNWAIVSNIYHKSIPICFVNCTHSNDSCHTLTFCGGRKWQYA